MLLSALHSDSVLSILPLPPPPQGKWNSDPSSFPVLEMKTREARTERRREQGERNSPKGLGKADEGV